ncbi:nitronate monooxygenase [Phragmitibacter flavus]|uniref:Propionate 3-nitronate monooxygenase n=1 Tax=Phragmitibacter flavus TaxID=2576071 RepID=A0A5R8KIB5_9BACT|nr:nitronate monooxygenase [Phragmitibacter flavus]TLD71997.1 nitronate monooxygenase [Phragmitibacter flavus]
MKSNLTARLGLVLPIIQGPFGGGLSTVKLAATVTNAGGMGSYGAHLLEPEEIIQVTNAIRKETDGSFVMNLWVDSEDKRSKEADATAFEREVSKLEPIYRRNHVAPPVFAGCHSVDFERQAEAILQARPPVFSFVFGIPSQEILNQCRKLGIITMGAATTLDEALAIENAGVDILLATGFEAGGHRPSFLRSADDSLHGTLALVRQIVESVEIPVVAAGGIADAKGVAAALSLGASAVQVGTAFLACKESGAHPTHKRKLFDPSARHTRLSDRVTGRLARFIVTSTLEELEAGDLTHLGYPIQGELTRPFKTAEDGLFYAGQGAPLLRHHAAAELTRDLASLVTGDCCVGDR